MWRVFGKRDDGAAPTNSAEQQLLQGAGGELLVNDFGLGKFFEMTRRGRLLHLSSGAVTLAAANVTGAALGTLAFINGFWNPLNSGVAAVIMRAESGTVSGTPGGPLLYNFVPQGSRISSASTGTWRSGVLGSLAAAKTSLVPLVNVVLATIPADTTTVGTECGIHGGEAAVAAGAGLYSIADLLDGAYIVPPGVAFGMVAKAAGTSHIVHTRLSVVEIPWPHFAGVGVA